MATIPLEEATIEADSHPDTDSALGDDDTSSLTTSLASSFIHNYVYENGRRYHGFRQGQYLFPNDETEQDRMDMLHHIYRLMLGGGLYKAPISQSPQRILDIGTGTGIYAVDIADEFPSAEVLGVDLSPIQAQWVPPNCRFVVDDRNMVGSIADWDRLFRQAFQHTRPDGYIEVQEFQVQFHTQDGDLPDDSSIRQWNRHLVDGMATFGKPMDVTEELSGKLKAAGSVDVQDHVLKTPVGLWPRNPALKELGQWMQVQTVEAVEPLSLAVFTRVLGWTEQQCRGLFAKVRAEFKGTRRQIYVCTHFIYGRRP
ncbi:S-adenosyl-L-methionine-dependent methyltransferase [Aspergillus avenaceus]|uniref:S-adenosyl-L-methionine-dependent methyltransferase n=1 Tax=Aspergillus avenaceus TaxID=36643 RepID=A0A5N6TTB7_ASPAV|nr:S-adenosyl-L-methionine-dependent methyltransferase [Aspergillus avenaceus]